MKKIGFKKEYSIFYLSLLGITFTAVSCTRDSFNGQPTPAGGTEKNMVFTAGVPAAALPSSRAIQTTDEGYIQTMDIIVFEETGGQEYFSYVTHGIGIDNTSTDEKAFRASVRISTSGQRYRFVMLANLRDEVTAAVDAISGNVTKKALLEKIEFSSAGKWNTDATPPGRLPMWGESAGTYAISADNSVSEVPKIYMHRAVARIDVRVAEPVQGSGKERFELDEVKIYNSNSRGLAVPSAASFDASAGTAGRGIAIWPSVPAGAVSNSSFGYDVPQPENSLVSRVYLSECDNIGKSADADKCYLLLGGYYGGSSSKTWYRLDFIDPDGDGLDVLRNHIYIFNVTGIGSAGYGTEAEAASSRSLNSVAELLVWDRYEYHDVIFNDHNYLAVSQSSWEFCRDSRTEHDKDNTVVVTTDVSAGWKVEKITDAGGNNITWLKTNIASGAPYARTQMKLLADENHQGLQRIGIVHLSAGLLSHEIIVEQGCEANYSICVRDASGNEISNVMLKTWFDMSTAPEGEFTVHWTPKSAGLVVSVDDALGTYPLEMQTGNMPAHGDIIPGGTGQATFAFRPSTISRQDAVNNGVDPHFINYALLEFGFADGSSPASCNFTVSHANHELEALTEEYYPTDAGSHNFLVRSNANWNISLVDNGSGALASLTTNTFSGGSAHSQIGFKTTSGPLSGGGYFSTAKVRFSDPTGDVPDVVVDLPCVWAERVNESNTYIIRPSGKGILIPVSRAEKAVAGSISAEDTFNAQFNWTDSGVGMSDAGAVQRLGRTGTGDSSYILVIPGSTEGVASVSAIGPDSYPVWSWLVWVTAYNPVASAASGNLMDRNLGASSNLASDYTSGKVYGVTYQYGRPVVMPSTLNRVFDSSGAPITIGMVSGNNLTTAIRNPLAFVTGWTAPNGQITAWNAVKTVYDPCPEGWRIPESGEFAAVISTYNGYSDTGITFPAGGGYYPSEGYWQVGSVTGRGTMGYYWTCTKVKDFDYPACMSFYYSSPGLDTPNIGISGIYMRSHSVRCIAE